MTPKYDIPWDIKDPTTIHAEVIKEGKYFPLEYGEDFTVDSCKNNLTLLIEYDEVDTIHIFEGEELKYIAQSVKKSNPVPPTRLIDDCKLELNEISPVDTIEKELAEKFNSIKSLIDKVKQDLEEGLKSTATIIQAHSLSLIDKTQTLEEHGIRLTETATKDDISNLKDIFVTPDELQSLLENTITQNQEAIKRLEQEIKDLKNASPSDIASLKKKLENLVTAQEKLKKFEAEVAEQITRLENKTDSIETGAKNLTEVVTALGSKVDNVDVIQLDKDVSFLSAKILELDKATQKIQDLNQKTDTLDGNVKDLNQKTKDTVAQFETINGENKSFEDKISLLKQTINTQKLEIADLKKCLSSFVDLKTLEARIEALQQRIKKESIEALQQRIKKEISGRTAIRCARLQVDRNFGDAPLGTEIQRWQYPSENSSGYLSFSWADGECDALPSAEDKAKRWRVLGRTIGYYGRWHYLQEVID
ncbi:hypothetical protein G293_02235 [Candidatus Liberibacter africanus PTSAPSY]|uniref:Uncharacterized protein n=2 Tax=Liberibacter africanus TaxID=34020 RepID=A0A0G3I2H6_LIBAF|nr:hypothetical protein G293_02235 [Candidatus Liberibacter africanus PTSAPSY]